MQLEAAEVRAAQQRLRNELGEEAQVGARDRDRGAAIEAAAEHGQPRERAALLVGEQTPRLVDDRSQAAVPLRDVAHRRGEEVDVALDLVRDLGAGEHGHPRGGELDAERHAVDEPADAERLRPCVIEGEARYDLSGPLDEQAHCRGARVAVVRKAETLDVEHPLTLDVEPLPRRRQELDVRCALDHLAQKPGALDQMLEVVEHEQRGALAEVVEQLVLRREAAVRAVDGELDRLGDGRREEVRRGDGGERDEVDAVWVAVDAASGGLQGEPGLAGPARADKREQAASRVIQQPVDRFELRRTADERRSWQREILHARLDRLEQREVGGEPVDLELVDALRRAQVLEPVHAQVAHNRVHERARRLRQEHLPAVADGGDPRAPVYVEPDVTLLGQPRLAGVQPHPHADRPVGQRALAVSGGGDGVRGAGEGDEERVTLCIDLDARMVGERGAESAPMLLQRLPVIVAEPVYQPRRALHVGEQQRHDTRRKIAHHHTIMERHRSAVQQTQPKRAPRTPARHCSTTPVTAAAHSFDRTVRPASIPGWSPYTRTDLVLRPSPAGCSRSAATEGAHPARAHRCARILAASPHEF